MKLKRPKIHKILLITLSNIGDVVLTFPVLDVLKSEFPSAEISVVVGPKGEPLLCSNPNIAKLFVFDKRQSFKKTFSLVLQLRKEKYDLAVDLRNTAIPFLIGAKYCTEPFTKKNKNKHMRRKHLERLRSVFPYKVEDPAPCSVVVPQEDREYIDQILHEDVGGQQEFVVIAPGAADERKRWHEEGFAEVCDELIKKFRVKIVFVGDVADRKVVQSILKKMHHGSVNLSGRTTLIQLAYLLQRSSLAIVNDSAPMHLASYLNVPVMAIFGPTDPCKYGPWSSRSRLITKAGKRGGSSRKKEKADFMKLVQSKDVLGAIKRTEQGFGFKP